MSGEKRPHYGHYYWKLPYFNGFTASKMCRYLLVFDCTASDFIPWQNPFQVCQFFLIKTNIFLSPLLFLLKPSSKRHPACYLSSCVVDVRTPNESNVKVGRVFLSELPGLVSIYPPTLRYPPPFSWLETKSGVTWTNDSYGALSRDRNKFTMLRIHLISNGALKRKLSPTSGPEVKMIPFIFSNTLSTAWAHGE